MRSYEVYRTRNNKYAKIWRFVDSFQSSKILCVVLFDSLKNNQFKINRHND